MQPATATRRPGLALVAPANRLSPNVPRFNLVFPWGITQPGADANLAVYGNFWRPEPGVPGPNYIAPVGSVPAGNGKWGQADLAGNLVEWGEDWYWPIYAMPCVDCATLNCGGCTTAACDCTGLGRVQRGGDFQSDASLLYAGSRGGVWGGVSPATHTYSLGARCARPPGN